MRFATTLSLIAATASTVSAQAGQKIQVAVGQNGLKFTPEDIQATVGTLIEFSFFPKNHSVTQSSFKDPCHPLANGFFSTFQPVAAGATGNQTFTITVVDSKPIWIYCGQTTGNHCQSGMVASINAPSTGNTLLAFKALAQNATLSSSPAGGAVGGILALKDTTGSSAAVVTQTVTKSVTATVTTEVTKDGSSYTTTYGTTYGTTYATVVAQTTAGPSSSTSGSGTSSSSSAKATQTGSGALRVGVQGGMAVGALVVGLVVGL